MQVLAVTPFIFLISSLFATIQCHEVLFLDHCKNGSIPTTFPISGPMSSGSIVTREPPENGTWYPPDLNCTVTFSAEENYHILLTFSNISLRNSSLDNLTVHYNNGKSSVVLSGQQVCSSENCEGLKFDSGEFNNVTVSFLSAVNISVPQNVTGFQAHYTVYDLVDSKGACKDSKQFLCENGHCIWYKLVCDNHNNCGDRSDERKCSIPLKDTVWGIVIIVIAILSVVIFVPLFICLATYGTKSIVKSITLSSNEPTPLVSATDCGETSGLLTSSQVVDNCWPGTSYERSQSLSYGTSHQPETADDKRKLRSMSEASKSQGGKVL